MLSPDQVPTQIEQVTHCSVSRNKPLGLQHALEPSHPPLSDPSCFMRLLSPIILILLSAVDRVGNQLTMSNTIASQFGSHNLPRLDTV